MPSVYDIDLVGPAEVTEILEVDEAALLELVNSGRLPAYRIGDSVRFRAVGVADLMSPVP